MPKESLRIDHSELTVPPWPTPEVQKRLIPLPKGWEKELPLPTEALDPETGKLIAFCESAWVYILPDSENRNYPSPNLLKSKLPVEFFSHQLNALDLTDVEAVRMFCSEWGVALAPILSSKKRFIASRLHNQEDMPSYYDLFPGYSRAKNDGQRYFEEAFSSLDNAVILDHGELFPEFLPAVVASEYARRHVCSYKSHVSGGIVSYLEVAQTLAMLRESANLIIAAETTQGKASKIYEEIIAFGDCSPANLLTYNEIMNDEDAALEERRHNFLNVIEPDVADALDYVSLTLSSSGALNVWRSSRTMATNEEFFQYHCIQLEPSIFDIRSLWQRINPSYIDDPFYEGSLVEAICAQLVNTCNDTESWKRCGNKTCGRWFKYKQPSAASGNKQERKRAGIYCSDKCSNDWRNHQYSVENKVISQGIKAGHDDGRIIAKLEMTDEFYSIVPRGMPATPKQAADRKKAEAEYQRVKARWQKKIEQARKKQG